MRISELERQTGLGRHTLRFYEQQGLLSGVSRLSNGYRNYPPETVEQVRFIRDAQSMGFSLAEIGLVLKAIHEERLDCDQAAGLIAEKLAEVEHKVAELERLRLHLLKEKARLEADQKERDDDLLG